MRSSVIRTALWFSTVASATYPLAVLTPCPSCPSSVAPAPVTVTAQYQPVITCHPEDVCTTKKGKKVCHLDAVCQTYDFVSTVIPCDGGASSVTVTKTDQPVKISHVSTVLTEELPCPTPTLAPSYNGTALYHNSTASACTSTKLTTLIVDVTCPYNELGPIALPPYGGSGLCKKCAEDKNGDKSQAVEVVKCLDGKCQTYTETWISTKVRPQTSTSEAPVTTHTYCPSSGVYTIPVVTTCSPEGPEYTKPVTKSFDVTTTVNKPQTIEIVKTVTVTFVGKPAPTKQVSSSACPLSTKTYCSTNGVHTIPIVTTVHPTNPAYTKPVTTTVYYTTTVTDGPKYVDCTTTVTVTFTSTVCPATVISGTTQSPTKPASTSAVTTTSAPSTPTGTCEYAGCFGSPDNFPDFHLVESSHKLTVDICTSECVASGYPFSGLYGTDCYCSSSISSCDETNGKCTIPCPGNSYQTCGGNLKGGKKAHKLFDVYECSVPSSTTPGGPTSTNPGTPDPSSDPDVDYEKRSLQADMQLAGAKKQEIKLRRGGLLKSSGKRQVGNVLAKRDFGVKRPFGL